MPERRNNEEESAADREIALTRITSALTLVLAILFWATTPSSENRSIRFSIQGSLAGDVACAGSEGECIAETEMIQASQAMPQEFNVPHAIPLKAWTDLKRVSSGGERGVPAPPFVLIATFAKEGKAQLTMRMVFASTEDPNQTARE
jgi:hypothetical protein